MWCLMFALVLRRLLLARSSSMFLSDLPALFPFALPHTCIWIPPDCAAGE